MKRQSAWKILRILFKIFVILIFVMLLTVAVCHCYEKDKKEHQRIIEMCYSDQNKAFPADSGYSYRETVYQGYESKDEVDLYVYLSAYNECLIAKDSSAQKLTLADIEDYLSSEYNEDGSLRICSIYGLSSLVFYAYHPIDIDMYTNQEVGNRHRVILYENYPHIADYMNWFWGGGMGYIEEYIDELRGIAWDYYGENLELEYVSTYDMNIEQWQELINKKNDPTYVINKEIMTGE